MPAVCAGRFRANPAYELVRLDRLSPLEKEAIEETEADPDLFGILRPRSPGLGTKCVSRDTALLWLLLQDVDTLPKYAMSSLAERCDDFIAKLVLDGVLEVEIEGEMHSGPDALSILCPYETNAEAHGSLAALSRRAIRYAVALGINDPTVISARLYAFNRVPLSVRWQRQLSGGRFFERFLRIGTVRASSRWGRLASSAASGWAAWQAHNLSIGGASVIYKLYVSPACSELCYAIHAAADVVFQSPAFQLKFGNDVGGLLRPDKFVAYFSNFADLQATAAEILERLKGCGPHGTPFTAELGGDGLVSWGIDPSGNGRFTWIEEESWRGLICNRLAAALVLAQSRPESGVSPEDFALKRLALEGIDTDTWAPTSQLAWA